jgi:murein DD-endopeptidase MepM/ murein hydrolase activator NlpD
MRPAFSAPLRQRLAFGAATLALLAGCAGEPMDFDLRRFNDQFSTTEAALNARSRPAPDARGIISYPNYQVVVARRDDTARTIAERLGIDAGALARHNGIDPDTPLRRDEVLALPTRVAEPAGGPIGAAAPGRTDVAALAGAAIDRAGPVTTTPLGAAPQAGAGSAPTPAAATTGTPPQPFTAEPIRHQVGRGETAYTIARLYDVPVRTIAEWNGLGPDLAVREGQQLMIPGVAGPSRPVPVLEPDPTPPGAGSPTPVPPSAASPLPQERPVAAAAAPAAQPAPPPPDIGRPTTPARSAPLVRPVEGSIIRAYAPGRNEGIDIGAPAGTPVKAAAAGTVAAVTTNTEGIQIVVIRHEDNLLTVYTHLENLTVARDARVSQGQVIGRVRPGDPSFLHFEVRRGMQSVNPTEFLP